MTTMHELYLVALGSNRRHPCFGSPASVLAAAYDACAQVGEVIDTSAVVHTAPVGPAQRRFANAACIIATEREPPAMLTALKGIERAFGRRRGRRWGDRVLDCDIVLWNGGHFAHPELIIPHPAFRTRRFVLDPAVQIAPDWRDPVSGLTIRQLHARLAAPRPARSAQKPSFM